MSPTHIGASPVRVEGRDKVLGRLRYTADLHLPGAAHAVLLQATIAHGEVTSIDAAEAIAQPGVLHLLTPNNCPKLHELPSELTRDLPCERRPPLADWNVYYAGQHLALLVAETLVQAQHAASLVRFTYRTDPAVLSPVAALHSPAPIRNHGQIQSGPYQPDHFTRLEAEKLQYTRGASPDPANIAASLAATYTTPVEHHHPIETSATTASWSEDQNGDQLTLHDTTRWLLGSRKSVASYLNLPESRVHVLCPFLGGAFGSKGFLWQHVPLVAVAAFHLRRPVTLVLSRAQMVTSTGHRPETLQQLTLAADSDHRLLSTEHHTLTETSVVSHFTEPASLHSRNLYQSPHAAITHTVARTHRSTPVFMRAPGEAPGLFALESAMDELAYTVNPPLDPLALRLRNEAPLDQDGNEPYTSKHLRECLERGATRFGWHTRPPTPRSLTRDGLLVGQGLAVATYPGRRMPASAAAALSPDGLLTVRIATHELGNGVRTILTQVAADASGLSPDHICVLTGSSDFPEAPYTGASQTTATTGPAVFQAATLIRNQLLTLATRNPASPFHNHRPTALSLTASLLTGGSHSLSIRDLLALAATPDPLSATATTRPPADIEEKTSQSFGAHFVEVEVDEPLGLVRIVRWVGVFDGGRILNPRLARSQILGGIVFAIGMTLLEETVYDPLTGNPVNASLGEYHLPTSADVPADIDVTFLDYPDLDLNPLGARGIGELGIVGAPAAIANAIFHATGRRHRSLPIRPDHIVRTS